MLRRTLLLLGLGTDSTAVALAAGAEPRYAEKAYRIGVLCLASAAEMAEDVPGLREALRGLGWISKRSIVFEERYADSHYERLPQLAVELVDRKVDLIVTIGGTPAVQAAMSATRQIPIVFTSAGDPVGQKIVRSLVHPGGNVTGFSLMSSELVFRRLSLMKEVVPGLKRYGYIVNGANGFTAYIVPVFEAAGRSLDVRVDILDIATFRNFELLFEHASRLAVQALGVQNDTTLNLAIMQLGLLALKHRLPIMARRDGAGVLLTYAEEGVATSGAIAAYVDKILKGAKAGDLPIAQPTKFWLAVNLKTAEAIGITVPRALLLQADEVIR